MTDTPYSLLERLRRQPNDELWSRLVDLYTPLLLRWLGQAGVNNTDAEDLVQEVLLAVVRGISSFQHNQRRGAFRLWLHTILLNRLRSYWNAKRTNNSTENLSLLDELADSASDLCQCWEREHNAFLARRVFQLIENDFTSTTWQAFRRVVMDGAKPAEVAVELGLSVNAVLLAKSRVLRRARQEIDGLID